MCVFSDFYGGYMFWGLLVILLYFDENTCFLFDDIYVVLLAFMSRAVLYDKVSVLIKYGLSCFMVF